MAENAPLPPASAIAAHADATRGLPYYEKLRRDLRETLQKKRLMDKNLATLEEQIYRFENSYLEETSAGNIIKGFDGYIKGAASSTTSTGGRKKAVVNDADRVFSRSSAAFMRESPAPTPSSSQTTPSHALTPSFGSGRESGGPTPTESAAGGAGVKAGKKHKKAAAAAAAAAAVAAAADEAEEEGGPRKRARVSFGGGRGGD